jgi:hypothetical protein
MTLLDRIAFTFVLASAAGCSGTGETSPTTDTTPSEIVAGGGQRCSANPPVNARCASACEAGYAVEDGHVTCTCCAPPPAETCGGPPPNARCMACPGGGNGYKQIDGKPTCECCTP